MSLSFIIWDLFSFSCKLFRVSRGLSPGRKALTTLDWKHSVIYNLTIGVNAKTSKVILTFLKNVNYQPTCGHLRGSFPTSMEVLKCGSLNDCHSEGLCRGPS